VALLLAVRAVLVGWSEIKKDVQAQLCRKLRVVPGTVRQWIQAHRPKESMLHCLSRSSACWISLAYVLAVLSRLPTIFSLVPSELQVLLASEYHHMWDQNGDSEKRQNEVNVDDNEVNDGNGAVFGSSTEGDVVLLKEGLVIESPVDFCHCTNECKIRSTSPIDALPWCNVLESCMFATEGLNDLGTHRDENGNVMGSNYWMHCDRFTSIGTVGSVQSLNGWSLVQSDLAPTKMISHRRERKVRYETPMPHKDFDGTKKTWHFILMADNCPDGLGLNAATSWWMVMHLAHVLDLQVGVVVMLNARCGCAAVECRRRTTCVN
jgi:hypothetical protein